MNIFSALKKGSYPFHPQSQFLKEQTQALSTVELDKDEKVHYHPIKWCYSEMTSQCIQKTQMRTVKHGQWEDIFNPSEEW